MSVVCTAIESDEHWHALRDQCVGASEAATLVGEHPHITYWGLWARKSRKLPPIDDNDAMERGRYLEPVAVQMIRDRYPGWDVVTARQHFADNQFGIGATPDMIVDDPARGRGVIQIKSVEPGVFRRTWRSDSDAIRPPVWIAIQALMEAHLTGAQWAAVAPLVVDFGINCPVIEVPLHAGIVDTIKTESLDFWQKVIYGREPDPDYRRDHALIRAALAKEDGSEIDLSNDNELPGLLDDRETALRIAKDAKEQADAINAALLHKLGHAAFGRFNGGTISAKTINRKAYQVAASSYRKLTVSRDHARDHDADHGKRA